MASKIVIGWMWAEIHLDKKNHHLSARARKKIYQALFPKVRRSRKMNGHLFTDKGVKKAFDPNLMKKHFDSQ